MRTRSAGTCARWASAPAVVTAEEDAVAGDRMATGAVTASTTAATRVRDDEGMLSRCTPVTLRTVPGWAMRQPRHGQLSGHASLNTSPTFSAPACAPSTT